MDHNLWCISKLLKINIIFSEMSANEDNLNEAKRIQREEFNKRLLAAMALKKAADNDVDEVDGKEDENILVKIVKKKYEFIQKFDQSEAIQIQKNAELEFVKDLDKDEVIYLFLGNVYFNFSGSAKINVDAYCADIKQIYSVESIDKCSQTTYLKWPCQTRSKKSTQSIS